MPPRNRKNDKNKGNYPASQEKPDTESSSELSEFDYQFSSVSPFETDWDQERKNEVERKRKAKRPFLKKTDKYKRMSDPECKLTEHDHERAEDYQARAGEKIEIRRKIRRKVWEEKQKRSPNEDRIKDLKEKERILNARIKLMWDRKMSIERPQRWFDFEREKFNGTHRIVYKSENHTTKPEKALPNDPRWADRYGNPRSTPRSRARSGVKKPSKLSSSSKSKEPRSSGSVPENSKNSKNLKPSTSIPSQISAYANKNVKPSKPSKREVFYVPEDIRLKDKRPTGFSPSDPKSKKVAVTFDAARLETGVSCAVQAKKADQEEDYRKLYNDLIARLDRENYFKDKDEKNNDADDEDDDEDILRLWSVLGRFTG